MSAVTMNPSPWDAKTLAGWSDPHLANVEAALSRWVGVDAPVLLGDAMRYAVLDGGKRLRPLLVLPLGKKGKTRVLDRNSDGSDTHLHEGKE